LHITQSRVGAAIAHKLWDAHHYVITQPAVGIEFLAHASRRGFSQRLRFSPRSRSLRISAASSARLALTVSSS
jgi:hypothetical protein